MSTKKSDRLDDKLKKKLNECGDNLFECYLKQDEPGMRLSRIDCVTTAQKIYSDESFFEQELGGYIPRALQYRTVLSAMMGSESDNKDFFQDFLRQKTEKGESLSQFYEFRIRKYLLNQSGQCWCEMKDILSDGAAAPSEAEQDAIKRAKKDMDDMEGAIYYLAQKLFGKGFYISKLKEHTDRLSPNFDPYQPIHALLEKDMGRFDSNKSSLYTFMYNRLPLRAIDLYNKEEKTGGMSGIKQGEKPPTLLSYNELSAEPDESGGDNARKPGKRGGFRESAMENLIARRDAKEQSGLKRMEFLLNFTAKNPANMSGNEKNEWYHKIRKRLWFKIFYTEEMTGAWKDRRIPRTFFDRERDAYSAMFLPYLDYYMTKQCRPDDVHPRVPETPLKYNWEVLKGEYYERCPKDRLDLEIDYAPFDAGVSISFLNNEGQNAAGNYLGLEQGDEYLAAENKRSECLREYKIVKATFECNSEQKHEEVLRVLKEFRKNWQDEKKKDAIKKELNKIEI